MADVEKPIIFSGEMVRAILDGRKTQTRRVTKEQYMRHKVHTVTVDGRGLGLADGSVIVCYCPYGKPGDRLWVRETWANVNATGGTAKTGDDPQTLLYRATCTGAGNYPWKPSIHMPREASRITLEITGIRVDRVQDISEAESISEGVTHYQCGHPDCVGPDGTEGMHYGPRGAFRSLWQSINAKRGYGWDVNPWVWVIEFRRIEP